MKTRKRQSKSPPEYGCSCGAAAAVLEMEHFEGSAQVDITLVDNQQIRKYNNEHRHIDAVTDVLSFPFGRKRPV